jgi:hypothetical protein
MQQFVVPQFIDVEDKIFGPVTVRQFLILLAGGIAIFISYRLADFALFIVLLALFGGLSLLFAFVKVNGQDFHYFLLNLFQTVRKPSRRLWYKTYSKKELDYFLKQKPEEIVKEKVSRERGDRSHIQQLSLVVNTGGYYQEGLKKNKPQPPVS